MHFKNTLVARYNESIQELIYSALENGVVVAGTRHSRGIPGTSFMVNDKQGYLEIVINPSNNQLNYTDFRILSITDAVSVLMPIDELVDYFKSMSKSAFINAVKSLIYKISFQYTAEDIYDFVRIGGVEYVRQQMVCGAYDKKPYINGL